MSELALADSMNSLEEKLSSLPQCVLPLVHTFTPGLYVRQIFIPAGTLLTSMTHKTEHPFVVIEGEISVISGNERETYVGPYMGVTIPGTKRALYAHTDTTWLTFHANPDDLRDPVEIGDRILEKSEYSGWKNEETPSITFIGQERKES